ncbi:hypothetical protein RHSIM_Rhsim13G0214000 [Rhododendron simsii]|uniref:F-box domain-containing protein n=1 Tax=Rhododendron simsii TaxID=118357 RepID=A0A834L733_RHOSS|nr:hypothetical protein RHSIM_Rhsim13G0214000 [Rhododendron simsii]
MEHRAAKKKKKNQGAENQFRRLPDDVVLNIFDKIYDIKWLCRCFLVSKRFCRLISRVQTVSVKRMSCKFGLLGELSKDSPRSNLPGFQFLSVFTRIRSLNLEIASHFKGYNGSVFKWGAKFTAKHHGVTLLYAESLSEMKEAEEEAEDETENVITLKRLIRRLKLGRECMYYAGLWLLTLARVVTQHPTLQSITITDPKNKGVKLCLCDEKLVEFRIGFNWDSLLLTAKSWMMELENMRVGYVPVLQLPMSRYVMKDVINVTFIPNGDGDSEAYSAMLDAFVEEQGIFSEAVDQILQNHKDSITTFNFYDLIAA